MWHHDYLQYRIKHVAQKHISVLYRPASKWRIIDGEKPFLVTERANYSLFIQSCFLSHLAQKDDRWQTPECKHISGPIAPSARMPGASCARSEERRVGKE